MWTDLYEHYTSQNIRSDDELDESVRIFAISKTALEIEAKDMF